jgi:uncharacterized protein YhfF
MSRAVVVAVIALFTLSFAPVSNAHQAGDGEGDTVVWGT